MQAIQSNADHSIPSIPPFMQEEKEYGVITSVANTALEFIRSIFSNLATLALTPFYFITNLTGLSGKKESFPSSPKSNGSTTDPASSSLMQTLIDNRKAIIATASIGLGLAATYAAYYYMGSHGAVTPPANTFSLPLPSSTVNGFQFNFDLSSSQSLLTAFVATAFAYGAYRCLRNEAPAVVPTQVSSSNPQEGNVTSNNDAGAARAILLLTEEIDQRIVEEIDKRKGGLNPTAAAAEAEAKAAAQAKAKATAQEAEAAAQAKAKATAQEAEAAAQEAKAKAQAKPTPRSLPPTPPPSTAAARAAAPPSPVQQAAVQPTAGGITPAEENTLKRNSKTAGELAGAIAGSVGRKQKALLDAERVRFEKIGSKQAELLKQAESQELNLVLKAQITQELLSAMADKTFKNKIPSITLQDALDEIENRKREKEATLEITTTPRYFQKFNSLKEDATESLEPQITYALVLQLIKQAEASNDLDLASVTIGAFSQLLKDNLSARMEMRRQGTQAGSDHLEPKPDPSLTTVRRKRQPSPTTDNLYNNPKEPPKTDEIPLAPPPPPVATRSPQNPKLAADPSNPIKAVVDLKSVRLKPTKMKTAADDKPNSLSAVVTEKTAHLENNL